MSNENKPQEFILADSYISVTLKDGTVQSFRVACSKVQGAIITGDYIHVIEYSAYEQLKAENERLKKRLSGHQHNHITRGIKEKGNCPACDLHHDKAEIQQLKSKLKIAKIALENIEMSPRILNEFNLVKDMQSIAQRALLNIGGV